LHEFKGQGVKTLHRTQIEYGSDKAQTDKAHCSQMMEDYLWPI